jgi:hypothetical protein
MHGKMWRPFGFACAWLFGYAAFTLVTRGASPAHFYNPLVVTLGMLYLVLRYRDSVPLLNVTVLSAALGLWHGALVLVGRGLAPSDDATKPAILLAQLILFGAASAAVAGALMRLQLRREAARR